MCNVLSVLYGQFYVMLNSTQVNCIGRDYLFSLVSLDPTFYNKNYVVDTDILHYSHHQ